MIRDKIDQNIYKRIYDPTPGRPKHRWKKNIAGFQKQGGRLVGKCPQDIKLSEATELLQTAVPDRRTAFDVDYLYPKNLYIVFRGVIYRAVGGEYNNSYHAFPCNNVSRLDAGILAELRQRAESSGYIKQFERWVKDYA